MTLTAVEISRNACPMIYSISIFRKNGGLNFEKVK
jgi:hypothetical protein